MSVCVACRVLVTFSSPSPSSFVLFCLLCEFYMIGTTSRHTLDNNTHTQNINNTSVISHIVPTTTSNTHTSASSLRLYILLSFYIYVALSSPCSFVCLSLLFMFTPPHLLHVVFR